MRTGTKLLPSLVLLALCAACSTDKGTAPRTDEEHPVLAVSRHAAVTQDDLVLVLEDLLVELCEAAAKDSIASLFRQDPMVVSADTTVQGILVEYREGLRGGIIMDFSYGKQSPVPIQHSSPAEAPSVAALNSAEKTVPTSRETVMLAPFYSERPSSQQALHDLRVRFAGCFSGVGFLPPRFFSDDQATVDRFASLTGYGIVHIATHGAVYPDISNIHDVYFITGESRSDSTDRKYANDLASGQIPYFNLFHIGGRYAFNSEWFREKNTFTNNALIFAQACYSFNGQWPANVGGQAGLGAFIGFSGKTNFFWSKELAEEIIVRMTDTALDSPLTIKDWYDNPLPNLPRSYEGAHIHYAGHDDLTLWEKLDPCDGFPPPLGAVMTYQVVGTTWTFSITTEPVNELVGGYVVYRTRGTDDPPGLGSYTACDPPCGEIEVAADWWEFGNPSNHGRYFYEPPLYYICGETTTPGTVTTWTGTFGGSPASVVTEIIGTESVTVPFGTYTDALKIQVASSGALADVPMYFWFAGDFPGPIKVQEINSGDAIVLIGYTGPTKVEQGCPKACGVIGTIRFAEIRLLQEQLRSRRAAG